MFTWMPTRGEGAAGREPERRPRGRGEPGVLQQSPGVWVGAEKRERRQEAEDQVARQGGDVN